MAHCSLKCGIGRMLCSPYPVSLNVVCHKKVRNMFLVLFRVIRSTFDPNSPYEPTQYICIYIHIYIALANQSEHQLTNDMAMQHVYWIFTAKVVHVSMWTPFFPHFGVTMDQLDSWQGAWTIGESPVVHDVFFLRSLDDVHHLKMILQKLVCHEWCHGQLQIKWPSMDY